MSPCKQAMLPSVVLYPPGSRNAWHTVKVGRVKQEGMRQPFWLGLITVLAVPFSAIKTPEQWFQQVRCACAGLLSQLHPKVETILHVEQGFICPWTAANTKIHKAILSCLHQLGPTIFSQQAWSGTCSCAQKQVKCTDYGSHCRGKRKYLNLQNEVFWEMIPRQQGWRWTQCFER